MSSAREVSSIRVIVCAAVRVALCPLLLAGCASTQPDELSTVQVASANARTNADAGTNSRAHSAGPSAQRPVAMLSGQPISWDEVRPRLVEMGGGMILEEIVLERMLKHELALASITLDESAIALEERAALEALSTDPLRAAQLLESLRDVQALGKARWAALLWRNAALRALARRDVRMSEDHIREAFDVAHGPHRVARLLVVADIAAASKARERIAAGESFAEVTAQLSTDSSAQRGGMLAPIAKLDPSFPPAFREVLFSLKQGEISQAILLDNGYAIVQFCKEIPGDGADPAATRSENERIARRAQERIEMDRIARTLVRRATATILDESLAESWQRQLRGQR